MLRGCSRCWIQIRQLRQLNGNLGLAEESDEAFLTQQAVVCDEAGQVRGMSWGLVDCSMSLQLFTDQPNILRFTLVWKQTCRQA